MTIMRFTHLLKNDVIYDCYYLLYEEYDSASNMAWIYKYSPENHAKPSVISSIEI